MIFVDKNPAKKQTNRHGRNCLIKVELRIKSGSDWLNMKTAEMAFVSPKSVHAFRSGLQTLSETPTITRPSCCLFYTLLSLVFRHVLVLHVPLRMLCLFLFVATTSQDLFPHLDEIDLYLRPIIQDFKTSQVVKHRNRSYEQRISHCPRAKWENKVRASCLRIYDVRLLGTLLYATSGLPFPHLHKNDPR